MKISKKIVIFSISSVIFLSYFSVIKVYAQDSLISSAQIQKIRDNCLSTKNTLNQLHVSDALLRVNQGQIYESISTKLMDRFNNRVANNKMNNSSLVPVMVSYNSALNSFRSDYKQYEEHMSLTIDINCFNRPTDFYNSVLSARSLRNQVHNDVLVINQLIDQYQLALDSFEKEYQTAIGGM